MSPFAADTVSVTPVPNPSFAEIVAQYPVKGVWELLVTCGVTPSYFESTDKEGNKCVTFHVLEDVDLQVPIRHPGGEVEARYVRPGSPVDAPWIMCADGAIQVFHLITGLMPVYDGEITFEQMLEDYCAWLERYLEEEFEGPHEVVDRL